MKRCEAGIIVVPVGTGDNVVDKKLLLINYDLFSWINDIQFIFLLSCIT